MRSQVEVKLNILNLTEFSLRIVLSFIWYLRAHNLPLAVYKERDTVKKKTATPQLNS